MSVLLDDRDPALDLFDIEVTLEPSERPFDDARVPRLRVRNAKCPACEQGSCADCTADFERGGRILDCMCRCPFEVSA